MIAAVKLTPQRAAVLLDSCNTDIKAGIAPPMVAEIEG